MVMKLTPQYGITKFNLMSSVILLDEILSHSYIYIYMCVCVCNLQIKNKYRAYLVHYSGRLPEPQLI